MPSKELVAAKYRSLLNRGVPEAEAKLHIQRRYGETLDLDAAAAPVKAPKPTPIQEETVRTLVDKKIADSRLARSKSGTFTPRAAQDIVDKGLSFNEAASVVLSNAIGDPKANFAREVNRVSNAIELTAGSAAWAASRPQQVLFGLSMGEGWKAFSRFRLTVAKSREELGAQDAEASDLDTVDQAMALTMDDATKLASVNLLRDPEAMDVEPYVMEQMDKDLKFQDVMFKHLPEDEVDSFLQNHKTTGVVVGGLLGTVGDFFYDPLNALGLAAKSIGSLKYLPKAAKAAKEIEGLSPLGRVAATGSIMQAEASLASDLVKTVKARTVAGEAAGKALDELSQAPQDVDRLRELDRAQRAYMELDTKVREMAPASHDTLSPEALVARVGPKEAPELGKQLHLAVLGTKGPTRRHPATVLNLAESPAAAGVKTKGRTAESIRKEVLALSHASEEEVLASVNSRGWNNISHLQADLRKANAALKDDSVNIADDIYDIMNRFENLPGRIKKHLDAKGWGRDRIFRQHALARPALIMEAEQGLSKEALEQLATLGPSDIQETADAARRLAMGAHGEDIAVHGAIVPEYDVASHAPLAEWGDGKWIAAQAEDPRRVRLQKSGKWVHPEDTQRKLSYGGRRSFAGMVPGSTHIKVAEVVAGKLNPFIDGTRDFLNGWRSPVNALSNRIGYKILRDAHGQYAGDVLAAENWYARMLQDNGWGKMNKYGKLVYKDDAAKLAVRGVFRMLDAKDNIELATLLGKAEPGQEKMYFALRQWFDQAARDLQIPEGMFIRHYAPHMFPWADFKNGARPLEFVGMPVTASVGFDRLMVRHGAQGYTDDLNMVFQSYARGRYRKQHMEPAYEAMLGEAKKIRDAGTQKHVVAGKQNLNSAYLSQADYLEDMVREAKGYPAPLDQVIQRDLNAAFPEVDFMKQAPHTKAALRFTGLHYVGMLSGRPSYFLQNFASAMATQMGQYGPMRSAWSLFATIAPTKQGALYRKAAEESGAFGQITNAMQELDNSAFARTLQKVGRYGGIQHSEDQIRAMTWHASMSEQLKEVGMNWDQAEEAGLLGKFAKQAVLDTEFSQHVYGSLGRSPRFHKHMGKGLSSMVMMFRSFPFKHAEYLHSMGKKNPGLFVRYMAYSGWMTRVAAQAGLDVGRSVGLAPMQPGEREEQQLATAPIQTLLATGKVLHVLGQRLQGRSDSESMVKALDEMVSAYQNMTAFSKPVAEQYKRLMDGMSGARRDPEGGINRRLETAIITPNGQLNPDLVPALAGVKGMEDVRRRMEDQQQQENMRENMYQLNRYSKLIQKAYDAGDNKEIQRLSEEAIMRHGVYGAHRGIISRAHAAKLERRTRMVLNNIKAFPPAVIRQIVEAEKSAQDRLRREGR